MQLEATNDFSGEAIITFSVQTPCGPSRPITKRVFVGVPIFRSEDITVDGQLNSRQLCTSLSSHTLRIANVYGADNNCISWDDHGTTSSRYTNCDQINFTRNYGSGFGNSVFITASANNRCGIGTAEISMYPVKCFLSTQWYRRYYMRINS